MNLSLIQSALYFLVALAVASSIGFSSYFLLRLSFDKATEAFLAFSVLYVVALAFLSLLAMPIGLIAFLGFSLLWSIATWIERAILKEESSVRRQELWIDTFLRFSLTTGVSVLFCCIALVGLCSIFISWVSLSNNQVLGLIYGYCIGALFSSSITPILIWVWKTLQLRPGIDRHLREGEIE